MAARSTSHRSSPSRRKAPTTGAARIRIVWISFLAAMTLAGGLLFMLDGKPVRTDGLSMSALAAAEVTASQSNPLVTRKPIRRSAESWAAIVIHHSGSVVGNPASIEKEHQDRRASAASGHHFIIGNGNGMEDGQVHIGYRWLDQLDGAHASGPNAAWYNKNAVSICLVGDGNRRPFTAAQTQQLQTLVEALRKQLGLPTDRVLLASDIAAVNDPGRLYPAGLYGAPKR